jgi:hypothetical protein
VKKLLPSQWAGIILTGLIILSVFLPWIRLQPADASSVVERLAGREDHWVYDYVIMHSRDWRALIQAPSSGVSGYQLMVWAEEETYEGRLARLVAGILWGEDSGRIWMKLLFLGPLFGLAGLVLIGTGSRSRPLLVAGGSGLLLTYLIARWKMATALSNFLVAELVWNIGLWVHLYAIILLGFVLMAKAIDPRSKF